MIPDEAVTEKPVRNLKDELNINPEILGIQGKPISLKKYVLPLNIL